MTSNGFHTHFEIRKVVILLLFICTISIVSMILQGNAFHYLQISGSEGETGDEPLDRTDDSDGQTEAEPAVPVDNSGGDGEAVPGPPAPATPTQPAAPGPPEPEEEPPQMEAGPGESEIESNETGFALSGTEMSSIHYVSIVPNDSPGNLAPAIFSPPDLTIEGGTKVVWVNNDFNTHKLTSSDFEQIIGPNGDIFEYQFSPPGIFDYYCAIHPQMTGRVTVR